jgi:Na+-driven multidrug efflux pump
MTFLFQLVDTFFIGQLGTKELAAISFSYPIYIFIVSFFMGTAAGVSSVVGKALGEGAAVAKLISWVSSFVLMLLVLIKEGLFSLSLLHSFSQAKVYFKEIMLIASLAIAAQILNPIAIEVEASL